jgi:hypothetical protein
MRSIRIFAGACLLAAGLSNISSDAHSAPKASRGACAVKAAEGTGATEAAAKFQVYEAILQATDWGSWAAWMSSGKTPGYKVNTVKYNCNSGTGLGVTCRGQSTICKL